MRLNTASWAGGLGRVVMGVPGPVTSAPSAGVHQLVRARDALLVTSGEEVLEAVAPIGSFTLSDPRAPRAAARPARAPRAAGAGRGAEDGRCRLRLDRADRRASRTPGPRRRCSSCTARGSWSTRSAAGGSLPRSRRPRRRAADLTARRGVPWRSPPVALGVRTLGPVEDPVDELPPGSSPEPVPDPIQVLPEPMSATLGAYERHLVAERDLDSAHRAGLRRRRGRAARARGGHRSHRRQHPGPAHPAQLAGQAADPRQGTLHDGAAGHGGAGVHRVGASRRTRILRSRRRPGLAQVAQVPAARPQPWPGPGPARGGRRPGRRRQPDRAARRGDPRAALRHRDPRR